MNAGAFGGETAEVVERVVALDPAGRRHELRAAELGFGYRHSAPAGGLDRDRRGAARHAGRRRRAIEARMRAIKAEREASQPLHVATGGSTFKNPAAGQARPGS